MSTDLSEKEPGSFWEWRGWEVRLQILRTRRRPDRTGGPAVECVVRLEPQG
jgi:hypothetical protein